MVTWKKEINLRIILKWILKFILECSDTEQGPMAGACEHGNENSIYTERAEFLE